jgi:hypothetical protein
VDKKIAGKKKISRISRVAFTLLGFSFSLAVSAQAQTESVAFTFNTYVSGGGPLSGVIFDSAGNLYGTTTGGGQADGCNALGDAGCGLAYELSPVDGAWQETVLYEFTGGSDGGVVESALVRDASGNLYGTAEFGGDLSACGGFGCGVVYKLSPSGSGWTETAIYKFTGGADGDRPLAGLILDAAGNLYGTTTAGGNSTESCVYEDTTGCGVVFKLAPASGGGWTYSALHTFSGGSGGSAPLAGVTLSSTGDLFGTASGGGTDDRGLVFELLPSGGSWTFHILHSFTGGTDGSFPAGTLALDAAGNVFGTAEVGGADSKGVLFELSPKSGGWKFSLLHTFTGGHDGGQPIGTLTLSGGNLYGTTIFGGEVRDNVCLEVGCGVAYEFSPHSGGAWTETLLHTFTSNGTDGTNPYAGVAFNSAGDLFGTTIEGGADGSGVVFEIVP